MWITGSDETGRDAITGALGLATGDAGAGPGRAGATARDVGHRPPADAGERRYVGWKPVGHVRIRLA